MSVPGLHNNIKTDMIPALIRYNIFGRIENKVQITTQFTNYPRDNKGVSRPIKIPDFCFTKLQ